MADKKPTRQGYGEGLAEFARTHEDIVALDADLAHATGSAAFLNEFPERFFNAGIAEQNMIGMASGLSRTGLVPFASSFAVFSAGRAFEIIRNGVCYSKANVKIAGSHCGITATGDGGTHQCIEDLALMRSLPNMTVFCPCDYTQAKKLIKNAYEINGPVYMRLSREPVPMITSADEELVTGKAQILRDGTDVCIIATGQPVHIALEAAEALAKEGISAAVVNMFTIKPLDEATVLQYAAKCGKIVTMEEHSVIGGLGDAVLNVLNGHEGVKFDKIGVEDRFGQSGLIDELLKEYGMNKDNLIAHIRKLL